MNQKTIFFFSQKIQKFTKEEKIEVLYTFQFT